MLGPYGEVTEEEILWDLAGRIEGRMIAAGMETILSRPRSANPSNQDRANIANAFGADLMISLQADIYPNDLANGCASFTLARFQAIRPWWGEAKWFHPTRDLRAYTPAELL